MKRIILVFAAGLLALCAAAAMAEDAAVWPEEPSLSGEESAEVPAAEVCAHEHTQDLYYFDAPVYSPLDGEFHLVSGTAMVETDCLDCGAILGVTEQSDAQEVRAHVFHNGICALCGWQSAQESYEAAEAEESVVAYPDDGDQDQYFFTLTEQDLENAGETLVLRPEGRDEAIAVETQVLRREVDISGSTLVAEIGKAGDRHISTALRLYDADGTETSPTEGISLRVYSDNTGMPLTVDYTDSYGITSPVETYWVSDGYWIVQWQGNGLYEIK